MKNILKEKSIIKIILIGLIIRLILMPITLHPDLWGQTFTAYFFAFKGVFNIYEHLINLPENHPLLTTYGVSDIFIYPPLAYFTLGLFRLIIRPFTNPDFIPFVMANMSDLYQRKDLFWNIFLYKLPFLFIDIGLGLLMTKFFTDKNKKRKILFLWMINPATLYATFMMGQFDILPTLFCVLSLYFIHSMQNSGEEKLIGEKTLKVYDKKPIILNFWLFIKKDKALTSLRSENPFGFGSLGRRFFSSFRGEQNPSETPLSGAKGEKAYLAMVMLGIGGSYKMFPLLFIFPFAFLLSSDIKQRIKYLCAGFLPFIFSIIPFISSSAFRQMVIFSPKSQKMLYMGFPVSGAESIFPFIMILVFFYLYIFYTKKQIGYNNILLTILLLILSITHYHPQWFVWITPFLLLDLVKNNMKNWLVCAILFSCWFFIVMFFDQTLNVGLFNPINESLSYVTPISDYINKYFEVNLLKSIIRSIFAGTTIFYIYNLFYTRFRKPRLNRG